MEALGAQGMGQEIELLEYPVAPGATAAAEWKGWAEAADDETGGIRAGSGADRGQASVTRGTAKGESQGDRLTEEMRRCFETGRAQGQQEGRRAEHEAQAAAMCAEQEKFKRQLAGLVSRFAEEGDRYLHAVEQEVVKLALAVAARILRREAQMDPLLLTGAVRVALGQLAAASEVRLCVPATEVDLWRETIALIPKLAVKPIVAAGDGMRVGDCVIESKVGTVDLGVRSQLGEIERGFFDRAGTLGPPNKGGGEVSETGPGAPASEARA